MYEGISWAGNIVKILLKLSCNQVKENETKNRMKMGQEIKRK